MALAGIHVTCALVSGLGQVSGPQLLQSPAWSETLASAGTTTNACPADPSPTGDYCFEIRAAADSYVAIGAVPDATQAVGVGVSARVFVPLGETRNLIGKKGDKLAWVAA